MAKVIANKFQIAVESTPDVRNCYQPGLRALPQSHSAKISFSNPSDCNGSVNIDACVSKKYPNDNRWDYCFSYRDEIFFVEVHSAYTSQVTTMLNKLQWLKNWLNHTAPEINKLKAKTSHPFYWLQSGRFDILPNSPQARRMAQAGLKPIPRLELK